jgi:hypothetical protein
LSLIEFTLFPKASISSIKIIQPPYLLLAFLKSYLTLFAPIPVKSYWNSDAATFMKSQPASLASALARSVFPVPGGP